MSCVKFNTLFGFRLCGFLFLFLFLLVYYYDLFIYLE
jgi:hypothetical protein